MHRAFSWALLLSGVAESLENQFEQGDDHDQANQEDDADGAAEELEHCVSPGFFRLKVGTAACSTRFLIFLRWTDH
jgi:hypothetical protein